jgi:hypothetical protein
MVAEQCQKQRNKKSVLNHAVLMPKSESIRLLKIYEWKGPNVIKLFSTSLTLREENTCPSRI